MKWVFKEGVPIYQQIVETLRTRIANGTYPPGSQMPTVRDLALEAGVNPNTMQRALSELERTGLVHSERTSGRFVTENRESLHELRSSLAEEYIREMFRSLAALGLSREEIRDLVQAWQEIP